MRKQTKWAVILGAAAVMTFGACMTSFAAKGWVLDGGTWYYYDKDEEAVTETWQKYTDGKYYYLGEDGAMVTDTWVDGDYRYYTDANGARITNQWKYMFGFEDDDAEEESWFWFDSNGRMVTSKKVTVNGKVYYFDSEGKMLTGWINTENAEPTEADSFIQDKVVYAFKDGSRATGWAKLYAPGDEEEEDDDKSWYYFSTTGLAKFSKKTTINGKSYVFDEEGKMLSGWVKFEGTDKFEEIKSLTDLNYANVLYAGGKEDGSVKKSVWRYSVEPTGDNDDIDEDHYWYYLGSDGTLTTATNNVAVGNRVSGAELAVGENSTDSTGEALGLLKIGTKTYAFNAKGQMIDGLWRFTEVPATGTNYAVANYYFGKSTDGSLKTGAVSLKNEDTEMTYGYHFSATTSTLGRGSSGVQATKLYDQGLLVTAHEDSKYGAVIVGDKTYIVNESGKVMTSTTQTYIADGSVKYKTIGGAVYYTKDGTTPTVDSNKVDATTSSQYLHYISK